VIVNRLVSTDKGHPLQYTSSARGHSVIACHREMDVERLLRIESEHVSFLRYNHVHNTTDYVTITVAGDFVGLMAGDVKAKVEEAYDVDVLGGYFEGMKDRLCYVDVQDERIFERIGQQPYIKAGEVWLNIEVDECQNVEPARTVFMRELGERISKELFREGLAKIGMQSKKREAQRENRRGKGERKKENTKRRERREGKQRSKREKEERRQERDKKRKKKKREGEREGKRRRDQKEKKKNEEDTNSYKQDEKGTSGR